MQQCTHTTGAPFLNLLGAALFPYASISLFLYDRQLSGKYGSKV